MLTFLNQMYEAKAGTCGRASLPGPGDKSLSSLGATKPPRAPARRFHGHEVQEYRADLSQCLDLLAVLVSECVKSCIVIHISNGKMMLNGNNQPQMILQFMTEVQGMSHIAADNLEYAKQVKNRFIQGNTATALDANRDNRENLATAITVQTKIRAQLVGLKHRIARKNVHRDGIFLPIFESFKTEVKSISAGKKEKRRGTIHDAATDQRLQRQQTESSRLAKAHLSLFQRRLLKDRDLQQQAVEHLSKEQVLYL